MIEVDVDVHSKSNSNNGDLGNEQSVCRLNELARHVHLGPVLCCTVLLLIHGTCN